MVFSLLLAVFLSAILPRLNAEIGVAIFNLPDTISINEDKRAGFVVYTVTGNGTGPVSYILGGTDPANGPFKVEASSGKVRLTAKPDYEKVKTFSVQINVTDGIFVESENLTVEINDIDEKPIFSNLPATKRIMENTTGGSVIFTAEAVDPEGGTVTYASTVSPDDGTIEFDGADVKLVASPDFTVASYVVRMTATAGPSGTSRLTINIINVVNDVPIIANGPVDITELEETTAIGTSLVKIDASDADGDQINYEISVEPTSNVTMFTVDSSGDIKLAAPLDYESGVVRYLIEYKACDAESCSGWNKLIVTVLNANDPPTATYTPSDLAVPENQADDYGVAIFYNVTDDDPNDHVFTYGLVPSLHSAYFSIDSVTGNMTLIKAIDLEDVVTFPDHTVNLTVAIRDPQGAEGYVNVTMAIEDDNEFDPVFQQLDYKGIVTENSPFDTSVLMLNATDADLGPVFGRVSYQVEPPGYGLFFVSTLESGLGLLKVVGNIDRESYPDGYIRFKVYARDGGLRRSAIAANVELEIEDVNDKLPKFTQTVYEFIIRADAEIGTAIGNVRAIDGDAKPSLVTYGMVTNDSDVRSRFFINYLDGQVTVNGQLFDGQTYEMYAFATEHNTTRSATEMALVRVKTYDQVAALVDWELDTGGKYMGTSEIEEFERNLAATCQPCWPKVVQSFENDNGNWVFRTHIATAKVNDTAQSYMSKKQIIKLYTSDNRKKPTSVARAVAPSGEVVSINESFVEKKRNWWLETAGGIIVIVLLCLIAFGIISTLVAVFFDYVWYSRRAEARIY